MDRFETILTPGEEKAFQAWKAKWAPGDPGDSYDYRGAFRAGFTPDASGHWLDTFKKPNHPTFSNESIYAREAPARAGRWEGETYVPPSKASTPPENLMSQIDYTRQGTTFKERMLIKALAASPDEAAAFLRSQGYEAYPIRDGLKVQLAVRRPGGGGFGVIDPAGAEWSDIADIIPDLVQGGLVNAGTLLGAAGGAFLGGAAGAPGGGIGALPGAMVGGMAGSVLGGAAAGGAVEAGRQGLGMAAGVNQGLNPDAIKFNALVGGAAPVAGQVLAGASRATGLTATKEAIGRGLSKGVGLAGSLAKRLLASMAGLRNADDLSIAMARRELETPGAVKPMEEVLAHWREIVGGFDEELLPQYKQAQDILNEAAKAKSRAPLAPVIDAIQAEALKAPSVSGQQDAAVKEATNIIHLLAKQFNAFTPEGEVDLAKLKSLKIDPRLMQAFKKVWQKAALPALEGERPAPVHAVNNAARQAAKTAVERSIRDTAKQRQFVNLMENEVAPRRELMTEIADKIKDAPSLKSGEPINFLRGLGHPENMPDAKKVMERFQQLFPQHGDLMDEIKMASLLDELQAGKSLELTAMGGIKGPGLGAAAGSGIGGAIGGIPGAVAGGAAGTALGYGAAINPVGTARRLAAGKQALTSGPGKVGRVAAAPGRLATKVGLKPGLATGLRTTAPIAGQLRTEPKAAAAPIAWEPLFQALSQRPDAEDILADINAMPAADEAMRFEQLQKALAEPPDAREKRRRKAAGF